MSGPTLFIAIGRCLLLFTRCQFALGGLGRPRGWSLPYYYSRMAAEQAASEVQTYGSIRSDKIGHHVSFRVGEELGPSQPGTLEHFLLERYLLFVKRKERIHVGQVHHAPYHAYLAEIGEHHDGLLKAAGLPEMSEIPDLVHYSPGVDVEVFGIQRQDSD